MEIQNTSQIEYRSSIWWNLLIFFLGIVALGNGGYLLFAFSETISFVQSIPILFGFICVFIIMGVHVIDLFFGVRRVVLTKNILRIVTFIRTVDFDVKELANLHVARITKKSHNKKGMLYRVSFLDPNKKRYYFTMDGEKGRQIYKRLKLLQKN